ncbi:MAG: adenylate/guanylate cyclase domain-containing protein [Chthoniobacterales bacterium]|nr:adenylate/guanylate cyclase domain-containing protein [Chthoniobacterales bacterium]
MKRRLATILVGDVVGYSALMEADEEGTARRLQQATALARRVVAEYEGRIFKLMGDAILAEFGSPLNALRAAVGLRAGLAETTPPLQVRLGLHLADVIESGDDLIGDGVNLAARIQQQATPGAIEISGTLFEQVRRHSPFTFDSLGMKQFKNISEGLPVYRLRGEQERWVFQVAPTERAPRRNKRPFSIAVVPLTMPPQGDDLRFLAEGLSEDIILELGRFRHLFVSSRTASAVLENEKPDPVRIGNSLGVCYLLSGSVRRLGPNVRLQLSLAETEEGSIIWNDRIDRPFEQLLDALDEIVARIAATVIGRLEEADIMAARRRRPESMSAYECHLRGLELHRRGGVTDENLVEAIKWFDRAIEADPNFGRPYAMKVCAVSGLPDFDFAAGEKILHRALELDPNDPEANRIMGSVQMAKGDFKAAHRYHEKAMELSPNDAYIKGRSAAFHNFIGQPERALELLDLAEALDPYLPVWCVEERGVALYGQERYSEALQQLGALPFQTRRSRLYQIAAQVASGHFEQAQSLARTVLALDPNVTLSHVLQQEWYRDPAVLDQLKERLLAAGLPERKAIRRLPEKS